MIGGTVLGFAICATQAHAQSTFSKLIVFGDSLSDTGNIAIVDLPPPYFNNRISDGPVAADLLAQAINSDATRSGHLLGQTGGFNFAVSGGNIFGGDREDLSSQVSAYLQRAGGSADPDALYFVFMGGNDLRDVRSFASSNDANAQITRIIDQLDAQLARLVASGARAFLIPNVANIGRLPETIERESGQPGLRQRAETYTRTYNLTLANMLSKYTANPNLSVVEFDLFTALETILNNAGQFGFSNIEEGCFDPDEFDIATECLVFGFERRPFFDQLHPSSATNSLISNSLVQNLPVLGAMNTPNINAVLPAITSLLLDD